MDFASTRQNSLNFGARLHDVEGPRDGCNRCDMCHRFANGAAQVFGRREVSGAEAEPADKGIGRL